MTEISLFRLYALRIVYFLILLFLGTTIWPGIVHHQLPWTLMSGVAHCMLAAVGVMALIGIFRPLKMLPVLFYEIAWKATWLIAIGLPLRQAGRLDPDSMDTFKACAFGVVLFAAVIPWPYVWANYVKAPGERWR